MDPTEEDTPISDTTSGSGGARHPARSLTEWVVLAVIGEAPRHGFAIARELQKGSDLGRILTVHRPVVYRALHRLDGLGLIEADQPEPSTVGPQRIVYRLTSAGRATLHTWFEQPVAHVRDLRIEFLIKLRLLQRIGRDPQHLVVAQHRALADTLAGLADGRARPMTPTDDVVVHWRRHSAAAAAAFLVELAGSSVAPNDLDGGVGDRSA